MTLHDHARPFTPLTAAEIADLRERARRHLDRAAVLADVERHADEARIGFLAAALPSIPAPTRLPQSPEEVAAIVDQSRARVAMAEAAGLRGVREEEVARLEELARRCEEAAAREDRRDPGIGARFARGLVEGFVLGLVSPGYPGCYRTWHRY